MKYPVKRILGTNGIDLTGKTYGRLTVLCRSDRKVKGGQIVWTCECSCGKKIDVYSANLRNGVTTSCGCAFFESTKKIHPRHGYSNTPTYGSWANMLQRCTNKNCPAYPDYGGRGITVCERWMSFDNFLEDMGERPQDQTLDRIDPHGPYCKENCRWAPISIQNRNKRPSKVAKMMKIFGAQCDQDSLISHDRIARKSSLSQESFQEKTSSGEES